jgi:hypothetical protein
MNSLITSILLQADPATGSGSGSLLKFITGGGVIGYIIVLLSVVALNYLVLTAIWNTIQGVIETRLRAHEIDRPVRTWWQSLVVYLTPSPSPSAGERRI